MEKCRLINAYSSTAFLWCIKRFHRCTSHIYHFRSFLTLPPAKSRDCHDRVVFPSTVFNPTVTCRKLLITQTLKRADCPATCRSFAPSYIAIHQVLFPYHVSRQTRTRRVEEALPLLLRTPHLSPSSPITQTPPIGTYKPCTFFASTAPHPHPSPSPRSPPLPSSPPRPARAPHPRKPET
jgi:hypothetical protein